MKEALAFLNICFTPVAIRIWTWTGAAPKHILSVPSREGYKKSTNFNDNARAKINISAMREIVLLSPNLNTSNWKKVGIDLFYTIFCVLIVNVFLFMKKIRMYRCAE